MKKFSLKNILLLAGTAFCWFQPIVEGTLFLKYEGIDGEAIKDSSNHDKWIDVLSIDWSMAKQRRRLTDTNLLRGSTTATTKHRRLEDCIEEMTLKAYFEKSSKFEELYVIAKIVPSIVVSVLDKKDNGNESYLKYELTNVIVTSYQTSEAGADGILPIAIVGLNFEEIKVTYMHLE
jgi:type VI protein secretion system component Hcp